MPALGVMLAVLIPRCTDTSSTSPPSPAVATLRLALSSSADEDVIGADSIRFTIFDAEGELLCRTTFAYAAHRGAVDPLPCGSAITVVIEIIDSTATVLTHGETEIASVACDTMTVVIADSQLTPLAPTFLSAAPRADRTIALSWHDNATNEHHFRIERSPADTAAFDSIGVTTDTHWIDSTAASSASYRYAISAVNGAGRSPRLFSMALHALPHDTSGPAITVLSHRSGDTVRATTTTLFGTVADQSGIAGFRINDTVLEPADNFWSLETDLGSDSIALTIAAIDSVVPPNRSELILVLHYVKPDADTIPPTLNVLSHADGDTLYRPRVSLRGTASDDSGVDSVFTDGLAATLEGVVWHSDSLTLEQGLNGIAIHARDSSPAANDTTIELRLVYIDPCADSTPPRITFLSHTNPDTVSSRVITILGSVASRNGTPVVMHDGTDLTLTDNVWEIPGHYLAEHENEIVISASDSCSPAHTAQKTLLVYYIPTYVDSANHAPYFTVGESALGGAVKAGVEYRRTLPARDTDIYDRHTRAVSEPLTLVDSTSVSWTPALADTGSHHLWAVIFDQDSARDSVFWELTVLDPRLNTPPSFVTSRRSMDDSVMVGKEYRDTIAATDLDTDDRVVYSLEEPIGDLTIDPSSGIVLWRPDTSDLGLHAVTAIATDDSGATAQLSWPILVYDPSLPIVDAGEDTVVSLNDTVRLHGQATSESGTITAFEWDFGGTGTFVPSSTPDTFLIAPDSAVSSMPCRFRAIDDYGRYNDDSMHITVLLDPPVADAGRDTVVWLGENFSVAGAATDSFGTIEQWEWDIGATGTFVTAPDGRYSGTAPDVSEHLRCVLRVTDDDGVTALDTTIVHVVGQTMRPIEGLGDWVTRRMGANGIEADEQPAHLVKVSPFMIDTTEITQRTYELIMGVNPSTFVSSDAPVEGITWYDAVLFCNARSKRDGFDTVYTYTSRSGTPGAGSILTGVETHYERIGYRLPSEAEWEAACGARLHDSVYIWGNDTLAAGFYTWHAANAEDRSHAVAQLRPNYFDLYDMPGNVWEWCNDWYSATYYQECATQDTTVNPTGPSTGTAKVIRGGSWQDNTFELRTANRGLGLPSWSSSFVGLRCVVRLR